MLLGGALAVAGCGSGDEDKGEPIPADTAAVLQAQLDNIQGRIDGNNLGACEDIFSHATDPNEPVVQDLLASLPEGVSADLRSALEDGFDHLWGLVEERCDELRAEQEQQDTETETVETVTETVPTDTIETTTTETVPPPTTETVPPPTEAQPTTPEQAPPDNSGGVQAPEGQG